METTSTAKLTQAQRWDAWTPPETLDECVLLFIEILEHKETSDHGREFRPNTIGRDATIMSCRVWDTHRMNKLLIKMKELGHKDQQLRQMYEWNI